MGPPAQIVQHVLHCPGQWHPWVLICKNKWNLMIGKSQRSVAITLSQRSQPLLRFYATTMTSLSSDMPEQMESHDWKVSAPSMGCVPISRGRDMFCLLCLQKLIHALSKCRQSIAMAWCWVASLQAGTQEGWVRSIVLKSLHWYNCISAQTTTPASVKRGNTIKKTPNPANQTVNHPE